MPGDTPSCIQEARSVSQGRLCFHSGAAQMGVWGLDLGTTPSD